MRILRWVAAAFALYSRIPVPFFKMNEDDMGHAIMFLPLVGAVTGGAACAADRCLNQASAPAFVRAAVILLIPLVLTGGFHADGFLDTEDALNSYQPAERKLEIMKDPHTGSFALLGGLKALLAAYAGAGIIMASKVEVSRKAVLILCAFFVMSRVFCALTSLWAIKAGKEGMLIRETGNKGLLMPAVITLQGAAAVLFIVYINPTAALAVLVLYAVFTAFYLKKTGREFGGVTGDTAGYYVTMSEVLAIDVLALTVLFLPGVWHA